MLTADLVRARVRKGRVVPLYVRADHARATQYAEDLCAMYAGADGWSRADLEEARKDIVGDAPDFLIARGLAKLLDDRCEWAAPQDHDPQALRAALFDAAFSYTEDGAPVRSTRRRPRDQVIADVGQALGLSAEAIEQTLYADHPDAERRVLYRAVSPLELLRRYDVALAQAVLLRAAELRICIRKATAAQVRALMGAVKFRQLLHRMHRNDAGEWILELDGPVSILQRATRYGLQLALLVPVLLHMESWSLEASIDWPKHAKPLTFRLSDEDHLQPYARLRGTWRSAEQQLLEERLAERDGPWTLTHALTLIALGKRDIFAPEITLQHADGRCVYIEIVGTWRRHWLRTRLDLLRREGPPNTLLCVSRHLGAEKEALHDFKGEIVEYAQIISLPRLLEAAERVAAKPAKKSQLISL